MAFLKNFFKGLIAGIGGIAPGLSGSVLLVILGLYEQTVNAIGTLFKNFKTNIKFLLPLLFPFLLGGALALAAEPVVRFLCKRLHLLNIMPSPWRYNLYIYKQNK